MHLALERAQFRNVPTAQRVQGAAVIVFVYAQRRQRRHKIKYIALALFWEGRHSWGVRYRLKSAARDLGAKQPRA